MSLRSFNQTNKKGRSLKDSKKPRSGLPKGSTKRRSNKSQLKSRRPLKISLSAISHKSKDPRRRRVETR